MTQDQIFATEGDQWFQRNRDKLMPEREPDVCSQYLFTLPLKGKRALEVGASNGWRLARLQRETGAACFGTDLSEVALKDGMGRFPEVELARAPSHDLSHFSDASFDLVLVSFVFHWVDRAKLFATVAEVDRVLKERGLLVIQDFDPPAPQKTDYHHLPGAGVFTYKQPYWDIFTASHLYVEEKRIAFDIGAMAVPKEGGARDDNSCAVVALRKLGALNYPLKTLQ